MFLYFFIKDPLENFESMTPNMFFNDIEVDLSLLLGFMLLNTLSIWFSEDFFGEFFDNMTEDFIETFGHTKSSSATTSFFTFIIQNNLLAYFPFQETFGPGDVWYTLLLSFIIFFYVLTIAFESRGLRYFKLFYFSSTPLAIIDLLIYIEYFSSLIRIISLALRMFANSVAGGVLVKIFFSLSFILFIKSFPISILAFLPLLLASCLILLELLVTILQAFVMGFLFSLYCTEHEF